jgi:predicted nucleic acid-binding protein
LKVLFDTNVVLDVLLDRKPFSAIAARLFARVEKGELAGILGATTVTTLHYLLTKSYGRDRALRRVRLLLQLFAIAPVDHQVLELAAALATSDFEDAVLHEAGRLHGAEAVVTRDPEGFREATLLILTPEDLEAALS